MTREGYVHKFNPKKMKIVNSVKINQTKERDKIENSRRFRRRRKHNKRGFSLYYTELIQ
jgi:hypothetical protein